MDVKLSLQSRSQPASALEATALYVSRAGNEASQHGLFTYVVVAKAYAVGKALHLAVLLNLLC